MLSKMSVFGLAAAVAGLMCLTSPEQAEARPNYMKAFKGMYEVEGKISCNTCHGLKDGKSNKKLRSEYADAFGGHLGGKNVKDAAAIEEALKATEADGDVDGKTYGELLAEGMQPPPHESLAE